MSNEHNTLQDLISPNSYFTSRVYPEFTGKQSQFYTITEPHDPRLTGEYNITIIMTLGHVGQRKFPHNVQESYVPPDLGEGAGEKGNMYRDECGESNVQSRRVELLKA